MDKSKKIIIYIDQNQWKLTQLKNIRKNKKIEIKSRNNRKIHTLCVARLNTLQGFTQRKRVRRRIKIKKLKSSKNVRLRARNRLSRNS